MAEHASPRPADLEGAESRSASTGVGPFGRRAFIAGATGAVAGAAMLPRLASAVESEFSAFRVLNPTRLVDTRRSQGDFGYTGRAPRDVGGTITVQVRGRAIDGSDERVPAEATAAVFTLVGLNRTVDNNFLSTFPSGTPYRTTANLNMQGYNDASANLVTVKLGRNGAVDVRAEFASEVVLDLVGVYIPTGGEPASAGRYRLLRAPRRVLNTRDEGSRVMPGAGTVVPVDLTSLVREGAIDADAQAVAINLAATRANRGYITAYPFGTRRPRTSTLNVAQDATRGIGTMVKLGTDADGRVGFNLFVEAGAHLFVDIAGFMTGPSASLSTTGLFVPVDPKRVLDTRAQEGGRTRLWPGWTTAFTLPPEYAAQASAIAMNLAVTRTMGWGFFTALGAQTRRREVSNLNVSDRNQNLSNHVITEVSTRGVEIYSSGGADVIADIVGWFYSPNGPKSAEYPSPPVNPPPPAAPLPYRMDVPRLALSRSVIGGDADTVVDQGLVWHWTGTGLVGGGGSVSTFAHRTEAGGPLRYIQTMVPGDRVAMYTDDQRRYTYEYVDRVLTSSNVSEILGSTRFRSDETLSIIACTVGRDSSKSGYPDPWAPTSLLYRIVVRLRLIGWEDIRPPLI